MRLYLLTLLVVLTTNAHSQMYFNSKWEATEIIQGIFEVRTMYDSTLLGFRVRNVLSDEVGVLESSDLKNGKLVFFNENGDTTLVTNITNGKREGYCKLAYPNGKLKGVGYYLRSEMHGTWHWYFENGQLAAKEEYKKGKIVNESYWNEDGSSVLDVKSANKNPDFIGGQQRLQTIMKDNLVYPKAEIENWNSGIVYVKLTIDEHGEICNSYVLRGVSYAFDTEALRVARKCTGWNPGKAHNIVDKFTYVIPITFKLEWVRGSM